MYALLALTATLTGLYPLIYLMIDRRFGLLGLKDDALLLHIFWNVGFYTHIGLGGLALLTGWIQFSKKFRLRRLTWHRNIGKVYVVSVLLSALAGIYIGFFSTGGIIAATGFISLGVIWFYTTLKAYLYIKAKNTEGHEKMMIYSYAACFGAVTLRIWLPFLISIFDDFYIAYKIVAWLSWVLNLMVAYLIIRNKKRVYRRRQAVIQHKI